MKSVVFEPIKEQDLEMILEWRNAPFVRKNMYTSHEIKLSEHIKWFNSISKDCSKQYFITVIDDVPVGVIGFTEINNVKGLATWAFYTSSDAPRGSGSYIEYYALEYAFNELALHKLRCEVLGFNQSVVKLHQKFNFSIEGQLRDAFFNEDEQQYHDIYHLGIFSSEWQVQREIMRNKLRIK
ncbi:UDP-4-amino-4,6-dideoxy-N-acetyl-beta-L-altrosamine N-acetyltransferase [Photobacterium toruni]|uniref:UDP-4-amino-4, 6-dideoxy-N-acetyl-beta-L-altrosamine N-acetyltransferase n=1 Tax=Photobacterium toruni TaxID=1935446 RepID=UPI00210FBB15|nr:UDP-4-amino-4,6-dideoxy-N-acetyl-beta-L-altrosamine N-acetyltransferase [Photobacterium toruni]